MAGRSLFCGLAAFGFQTGGFASCRFLADGILARCLLPCGGLSCGLLAFCVQPNGFRPHGILPHHFLFFRGQPCSLSALGIQTGAFRTGRVLAQGRLPFCLYPYSLCGILASGILLCLLQPGGIDPDRILLGSFLAQCILAFGLLPGRLQPHHFLSHCILPCSLLQGGLLPSRRLLRGLSGFGLDPDPLCLGRLCGLLADCDLLALGFQPRGLGADRLLAGGLGLGSVLSCSLQPSLFLAFRHLCRSLHTFSFPPIGLGRWHWLCGRGGNDPRRGIGRVSDHCGRLGILGSGGCAGDIGAGGGCRRDRGWRSTTGHRFRAVCVLHVLCLRGRCRVEHHPQLRCLAPPILPRKAKARKPALLATEQHAQQQPVDQQ